MLNVTAIGYGLFLAVNALAVWGGVISLAPEEMFWFTLAEATAFALTFFARAVGSYRAPARTRKLLLVAACLPYAAGWACMLGAGFALAVAGGMLIGIGSAGFYLLWGRLFAGQQPAQGTCDLLVGTACAPVFYLVLMLLPPAARSVAAPVAALAIIALAIAFSNRGLDFNLPMFSDPPVEHARVYRRAIADTWRSAVSLGSMGMASGIMRAVAVANPDVVPIVNALSMLGLLVAALGLLGVWSRRGVELSVVNTHRAAFPIVLTAFLLMPLVPDSWIAAIAGVLFALYGAAVMLMMVQCAQIARDRGVNPLFSIGFFGGVVFALHDAGLIVGQIASGIVVAGLSSQAMLALAAVYLLSLLFATGQKREGAGASSHPDGNSIELVTAPSPPVSAPALPPETDLAPPDPIAANIDLIRRDFGLTKREAEVADLIARGDTVMRIAERLFISENTVRTHAKHIYQKLGINKKQQLRDLVLDYAGKARSSTTEAA